MKLVQGIQRWYASPIPSIDIILSYDLCVQCLHEPVPHVGMLIKTSTHSLSLVTLCFRIRNLTPKLLYIANKDTEYTITELLIFSEILSFLSYSGMSRLEILGDTHIKNRLHQVCRV